MKKKQEDGKHHVTRFRPFKVGSKIVRSCSQRAAANGDVLRSSLNFCMPRLWKNSSQLLGSDSPHNCMASCSDLGIASARPLDLKNNFVFFGTSSSKNPHLHLHDLHQHPLQPARIDAVLVEIVAGKRGPSKQ